MPFMNNKEENNPHILVDARFKAHQRGGDRCRYELAVHLQSQNLAQYTFLAYLQGQKILQKHDSKVSLLTAPYAPEKHPHSDYFEHIQLPNLVRHLGIDIYHGTFGVLPLRNPFYKTVLTVHDMAVFSYPQAYGKRFVIYARQLLKRGITNADKIITVSQATQCELLRYFPEAEAKVTPILNGIGQEFFDAAGLNQGQVDETCRRLAIPQPYILFVGNLELKKNLNRLIEAFKKLRSSSSLTHSLVIVGSGLSEGPGSGISSEQKKQNAIHFTGYIEDKDLPTLYRGADLVAYPSLYEGFGMPVSEGMAAGVPVLTSSVSSLPEVAGGAAMLVDPMDTDDIAKGLHRALTDSAWQSFAVDAGHTRANELSWAANAKKTADIYCRLWEEQAAANHKRTLL